jgi:hypothetical protein
VVFTGSIHKMVIPLEDLKPGAEELGFDFYPCDFVAGSLALARFAACASPNSGGL